MAAHWTTIASRTLIAAGVACSWSAAARAEVAEQVLDRVAVFNRGTALEMRFDLPPSKRTPDFLNYDLDELTGLSSCQLNGTRGLYCVDGREVRRWQDPEAGGPGALEFSCANEALPFRTSRSDICTALAVAQNGDVWVAGRRNSASILVRLQAKVGGNCPVGSQSLKPVDTERYCFTPYPLERPVILKVVLVEGEEAAGFDRGTGTAASGVLTLDVRNVISYYSDEDPRQAPVDLVSKADWLLDTKELLQDLALLQTPNGATSGDTVDNRLLVTTSLGKVLARQTDQGVLPVTEWVFDVPTQRVASASALCPALAPATARYGIATSAKTGRIYVTDRSFCQVLALEPSDRSAGSPGIQFGGLVNVADERVASASAACPADAPAAARYGIAASTKTGRVYVTDRSFCQVLALEPSDPNPASPGIQFAGLDNVDDVAGGRFYPDLTLSTANKTAPAGYTGDLDAVTGEYPPDGATVAPGIVVDLGDCKVNCDVIVTETQTATTTRRTLVYFSRVQLNSDQSRVVVFQIKNLADCRYRLKRDSADPVCAAYRSAVVNVPGRPQVPSEQYLNVTGMLPAEITDQFTGANALPPLYISPQYRARLDQDYYFDALLVVPEPGVVFKETFDADFDVGGLLGYTEPVRNYRCDPALLPSPPSLTDLLRFDVVTKASEQWRSPGAPTTDGLGHVDTIINTGCGSTRGSISTTSLFSYGLEVAYNPGMIAGDDQDDVYARLVLKLFADLAVVQTEFACAANRDQAGSHPIMDCSSLNNSLSVTRDKLTKCIDATLQPKTTLID